MPRRLPYIGGLPLTASLHFGRVIKAVCNSERQHELFPKILPALFMGLGVFTIGEVMGYILGAGDSVRKFSQLEFHRE